MDEEEKLKLSRQITDALPAPEEIRDDWGKLIIETVLPEGVWSRDGLSKRDRSLITIPRPSNVWHQVYSVGGLFRDA